MRFALSHTDYRYLQLALSINYIHRLITNRRAIDSDVSIDANSIEAVESNYHGSIQESHGGLSPSTSFVGPD